MHAGCYNAVHRWRGERCRLCGEDGHSAHMCSGLAALPSETQSWPGAPPPDPNEEPGNEWWREKNNPFRNGSSRAVPKTAIDTIAPGNPFAVDAAQAAYLLPQLPAEERGDFAGRDDSLLPLETCQDCLLKGHRADNCPFQPSEGGAASAAKLPEIMVAFSSAGGRMPAKNQTQPAAESSAPPPEQEKEPEKGLCKVCLDKGQNVLFLPCRHLTVCESCSGPLSDCPVCRAPIKEKIIAFVG